MVPGVCGGQSWSEDTSDAAWTSAPLRVGTAWCSVTLGNTSLVSLYQGSKRHAVNPKTTLRSFLSALTELQLMAFFTKEII